MPERCIVVSPESLGVRIIESVKMLQPITMEQSLFRDIASQMQIEIRGIARNILEQVVHHPALPMANHRQ